MYTVKPSFQTLSVADHVIDECADYCRRDRACPRSLGASLPRHRTSLADAQRRSRRPSF